MEQTTHLIIGLGNPDPALEDTYHNVGVLAVEWLAEHDSGADGAQKFRAHKNLFSYAKIGNRIFIRPLVFMNESGRAVQEAMRVFNTAAADIVIIHDDSDITIGEFKLTAGGGSAGHNGIRSIVEHLHTEDFSRIRIGIREKDEVRRKKAGDFVLSPITSQDKNILKEVFKNISALL
jgi:PTH1 family peptidyl-tRNA hydrolase